MICLNHENSASDQGRHNVALKRTYLNHKVEVTFDDGDGSITKIGIVTKVDPFGCLRGTWGPEEIDPDLDVVEVLD